MSSTIKETRGTGTGTPRLRQWRWPLLVALITVIGLILRIGQAWAMRYPACNGDFSIIGLMAQHMAAGTDYPVFAYGVAYMGSLEPALAALLAKLFHVEMSAFLVNLSPALVGTLLLPLLYLFGRDAGSRRAGVLAMLFCLVGSDTLFHNSVAPRGGYMNLMVCGVLALWLACRIAVRERQGERVSWVAYAGLGLAAGVAWWVTQLAVVFLLATGTILLCNFRVRMLKAGLFPALSGFLLGSLPWWAWNATHQWGSLDFGGGMARVTLTEGLSSFGRMFLQLVEMAPLNSWRGAPRLALFLGLAAVFIGLMIRYRIREPRDDRFIFRLAALLLAGFMIAVYSTSAFCRVNTTRYLLPLFPAMAVILAAASDWLLSRFRFPWGAIVFLLLIPPHILLLPRLFDGVPDMRAKWDLARQLQETVAPRCDGNFVGDLYTTHWLNFASREKLCVASLPMERYAPYARRVELADRRAYLNDYGDIESFITCTKASSRQMRIADWFVDYDLTPAANTWRYVEPGAITAVRDHQAAECSRPLLDSLLDSTWETVLKPRVNASLTFVFDHPRLVCGIRLLSLDSLYPWRVSIEGRPDPRTPWQTLMPATGATAYFWSGSRVMIDGMQYYQEFRITPPEGGLGEIRLTFHAPADAEEPIEIGEALILESVDSREASRARQIPPVQDCLTALKTENIGRFFGPRWLAEQISAASSNRLATRIPSLFTRSIHEMAASDSRNPYPLFFPERTGLFMDDRDVPRSRTVLTTAELSWREVPMGALTLLVVEADRNPHAGSPDSRVVWTEQGCLGASFSKEKAQLLYESALANNRQTDREMALTQLREAVKEYPAHYPARRALAALLKQAGPGEEAAAQQAVLKTTTEPVIRSEIRFANKVTLLGITPGTAGTAAPVNLTVKRGQSFPLTYFWTCDKAVDPGKWAVFVHFKTTGAKFQDDHVLLQAIPAAVIRYQPFEEILTEARQVAIPSSLPAGDYRIWIGLLDRQTSKRATAVSALPQKQRAYELPVTLTVLP